jgi:putative membrane protein insertion efficiency factor
MGGGTCRYLPSCSVYAREAILRYGLLRGGWKAVKRLLRCRPGSGFGWDPVK